MKLKLHNQIFNYPIQHIVAYGSWDNWKYPYCLQKNEICNWVNYGNPYKSHYCTNVCLTSIFYISINNCIMSDVNYYYKYFNTFLNIWIEPTDQDKQSPNWVCNEDGYWNMIYYSVH
jgi:hypothetical protein